MIWVKLCIQRWRRNHNVRIVAALAHVNVIVGVHRLLRTTLASEDLNGTVGNDLVHVHVALSTATGLEDDQRELINELARDDLQT